jgi:rhodanese-related sulfurtransferase
MRRSIVLTLGLLATFPLVAAGCGSDEGGAVTAEVASTAAAEGDAAATEPAGVDMIIIDVRTPEEFSQGHLEGAINLDVEGGEFEAGLADLDPAAAYSVYCRSGRRSAIAADVMAQNGFTEVTDLGSLESAATATGLAVTTG